MVADAEMVIQQSLPVLDVRYLGTENNLEGIEDLLAIKAPVSSQKFDRVRISDSSADFSSCQVDIISAKAIQEADPDSANLQFTPVVRSGSYADIGHRRYMEDEHICIDDLSADFGSLKEIPKPSSFYGVFDGHGGPEAAAYIRKNVIRLFFENGKFPGTSEVDNKFLDEVENSLRKVFNLADLALADDCSVSSCTGTTALTALVFGRFLMVANAGDCRAVLCRKGEAIEMSQDHKPNRPSERRRVEELGGFIDDGYLNGVLSVTRALGDWDMKSDGSSSPLTAEPEFRQVTLTEDDEFLVIGCDGIWDVMSSQQAVSFVRRALRRHDDPDQSAKDLAHEALRLNALDNLTVVVVCFSSPDQHKPLLQKQRCCSLTAEALCSLRTWLDG